VTTVEEHVETLKKRHGLFTSSSVKTILLPRQQRCHGRNLSSSRKFVIQATQNRVMVQVE
jgi:hypothetical protein